jgi:glycosyltransferase involved in cell wall biosynthesis
MNKVSVIMSTYKEPIDWIRQSIDSILNQTFSEFEFIIVVDNPKYKELISVLNDYAEADNRICIMVNENNIGLVKSLNKALSQCNGEYIVRMDADDISLPERIAHQIDYINNKKYDLVGCFYEVFYEDKTLRIAQGAKTHEVCEKILQYESCVAHPAWMVRKKVFESLGGYRDFDACEDYDFLIRTSLAGYKIGNTPEVLLRYRDNPKSISHEKCGKQYSIAQLLAENYRIGRETEIEEYKSYLTSAEHEKLQATYKVIADIDRERSLSDSSINKLICLCRLLCFHEFRKMKKIRQRIKKWKKTES